MKPMVVIEERVTWYACYSGVKPFEHLFSLAQTPAISKLRNVPIISACFADPPVACLSFSGKMNVLPLLGQTWSIASSFVMTSTDRMPARSRAAMPT
jgi:hypothetical protein